LDKIWKQVLELWKQEKGVRNGVSILGRFRETVDTDFNGQGNLYKKKSKKNMTIALGCYKLEGQTGDNRVDSRVQKIKDYFSGDLKMEEIEGLSWSPLK